MNAVIVVTSIIGVVGIFELNNGVALQELNIALITYSAKLERQLELANLTSASDRKVLRSTITEIRKQPIGCLAHDDFLTEFATKVLGTYSAFVLCVEDLAMADRALELLTMIENDDVDPREAKIEIDEIARQFTDHSYEFTPLVGKTVDALLLLTLLIMIVKGGSAILVSLISSRSIMGYFLNAQVMEQELHEKNSALGNSISTLEQQKNEIHEAKRMAEHNSLHDPLTNLPNRRYLDRQLGRFDSKPSRYGVLHIDIDHFKQINDTKGHDAGDFILVHVATNLKMLIREADFVARVGGDEFVVLASFKNGNDEREQLEKLSDRIVKAMREPVYYDGEPCRLTVSVGAALTNASDSDTKVIFSNADTALYRAKVEGRGRYEIFDKDLESAVNIRKSVADELIVALERGEIKPFYQPQFHSQSLDIAGMEALARWDHPSKGIISPAEFLPIAQELGVLGEIDRNILEQAVHDLAELDAAGIYVPLVSVNISAQRLKEPGFIEDIKAMNLPTGRIAFELLESVFLDNADDEVQWTIETLRELGIQLEIDDFGSGHASILGLLGVKPSRFKIDRQVIGDIDKSETTRALVKSIIDIGRSLNVEVLAEGIETSGHINEIQSMDCDYLQGYGLARPMAHDKLMAFFREESWRKAA